jgi:hypothetical protein
MQVCACANGRCLAASSVSDREFYGIVPTSRLNAFELDCVSRQSVYTRGTSEAYRFAQANLWHCPPVAQELGAAVTTAWSLVYTNSNCTSASSMLLTRPHAIGLVDACRHQQL